MRTPLSAVVAALVSLPWSTPLAAAPSSTAANTVDNAKPVARFRAEFQYSNAMYTAAGEFIARAHRSTWERVIQTRIFDALGMKSSFTSALHVKAADHALGYVYDEGTKTWKAVPPPESLEVLAPAGSLASTARDMTQWLRLLTGGGGVDGKRLVTEETLRDLPTRTAGSTPPGRTRSAGRATTGTVTRWSSTTAAHRGSARW